MKTPDENNTKESQYALRMPAYLYEWVQAESKKQHRSINSLIVSLIQQEKDKGDKELK